MNDNDIEISIYRILSNKTIFYHENILYILKCPSIDIKYKALLLYNDIINEEKYYNWIRSDNYENAMISSGVWSKETNGLIEKMYSGLDNLKVELYKVWMMPSQQKSIRSKIEHLKNELNKILSIKQRFFEHTLEGYADSIRNEYIICQTLYRNDELVFDYNNKSNEKSYTKFNNLVQEIEKLTFSLTDIKKIARSPIWRTYWACNKNSKLFDDCVAKWTDDQRLLYSMSQMYDSVREHPECPDEKVIEDDDMLDGWMIYQRREQSKNKKIKNLNGKNSLKDSKEIFLFPKDEEQFQEVMELNDLESKAVIKERMAFIKAKGKTEEYELPDVKRDIQNDLRRLNKR